MACPRGLNKIAATRARKSQMQTKDDSAASKSVSASWDDRQSHLRDPKTGERWRPRSLAFCCEERCLDGERGKQEVENKNNNTKHARRRRKSGAKRVTITLTMNNSCLYSLLGTFSWRLTRVPAFNLSCLRWMLLRKGLRPQIHSSNRFIATWRLRAIMVTESD